MVTYTQLNLAERDAVPAKALEKFSQLLGKPTRAAIRERMTNPHALNILQKLSIFQRNIPLVRMLPSTAHIHLYYFDKV